MGKQLELLKKALEMGASIEVTFHRAHHEFTKSQAKQTMEDFANPLNLEYEKAAGYDWYTTKYENYDSQLSFTAHFCPNAQEEIEKLEERLRQLKGETA